MLLLAADVRAGAKIKCNYSAQKNASGGKVRHLESALLRLFIF
jgi:hypothetical protein